ncbi:MAG: hypothetical protein QME50_01225 [Candidatus Bathyarchaeota archaeon]|nr:hypothetical protein [Candidatus Bathyarchaeota archaeon]
MIARLHGEGLIESEFRMPRRINRLTDKGAEIAEHLKEISENVISESVKRP